MAAAAEEAEKPRAVAAYDLTNRLAPFLDVHLMLPILLWAKEREVRK